jgi:hypothetical protein
MTTTRVLTWLSRAFYALTGVLAVIGGVYVAHHSQPTATRTTTGAHVFAMSASDLHATAIFFAAIMGSALVGTAIRTLATALSWPRALVNIAGLGGFGMLFTGVAFAGTGGSGQGFAVAFAVCGMLIVIASKVAAFVAFGAKDALARVEQGIVGFNDLVASREIPPIPTPLAPYAPSGMTFLPEPTGPGAPAPSPPGPGT